MARESRAAWRRRQAATERSIDLAVAEVREQERMRWEAAKAAWERAEAERVRFTAEDLAGAWAVRDRFGWHRVVRVSTRTVTVETGFSWTDRIPVERVLEYRTNQANGSAS